MKLHNWLIKNDERNTFYYLKAKNVSTLRKRINSSKETVIGRADKLTKPYRDILQKCIERDILPGSMDS